MVPFVLFTRVRNNKWMAPVIHKPSFNQKRPAEWLVTLWSCSQGVWPFTVKARHDMALKKADINEMDLNCSYFDDPLCTFHASPTQYMYYDSFIHKPSFNKNVISVQYKPYGVFLKVFGLLRLNARHVMVLTL